LGHLARIVLALPILEDQIVGCSLTVETAVPGPVVAPVIVVL
jgi:hypothetical protein